MIETILFQEEYSFLTEGRRCLESVRCEIQILSYSPVKATKLCFLLNYCIYNLSYSMYVAYVLLFQSKEMMRSRKKNAFEIINFRYTHGYKLYI